MDYGGPIVFAEIATMARKNPGRPPSLSAGHEERETVIHMKGSPAYVAWLETIHKKTHIPKVQIARLAFRSWAKENGHPAPPEI